MCTAHNRNIPISSTSALCGWRAHQDLFYRPEICAVWLTCSPRPNGDRENIKPNVNIYYIYIIHIGIGIIRRMQCIGCWFFSFLLVVVCYLRNEGCTLISFDMGQWANFYQSHFSGPKIERMSIFVWHNLIGGRLRRTIIRHSFNII